MKWPEKLYEEDAIAIHGGAFLDVYKRKVGEQEQEPCDRSLYHVIVETYRRLFRVKIGAVLEQHHRVFDWAACHPTYTSMGHYIIPRVNEDGGADVELTWINFVRETACDGVVVILDISPEAIVELKDGLRSGRLSITDAAAAIAASEAIHCYSVPRDHELVGQVFSESRVVYFDHIVPRQPPEEQLPFSEPPIAQEEEPPESEKQPETKPRKTRKKVVK